MEGVESEQNHAENEFSEDAEQYVQPREAGRSVTRTPRQRSPGDRNLSSPTVRICARLLLTALEPTGRRETGVKGKMNCFWTSTATCKIGFRKDGPLGKKRLDDELYSELREHARERVPDRNGPLHHAGGRKCSFAMKSPARWTSETPLASVQRTVQDGVTCCLASSWVGSLLMDHELLEPSKAWSHHVHTESATPVRGNSGKETKGEGGWVFVASGAPAPPRRVLRLSPYSLAVSLFCGVATGTSETSLPSPADFEADAARHSHLPVASGTPVSSRHCHGLWGAALEKVAPVPLCPASEANWLCCRR